jgi:hypothetical protein
VRTRSDVPDETFHLNDTTSIRDAAFSSGAQIISTDYQGYGMATRFNINYVVRFPGGRSAICNRLNAPDSCQDDSLEPEEYVRY